MSTIGRGPAQREVVSTVVAPGRDPAASGEPVDVMQFESVYEQMWWPMFRLAVGLVDHATVAEDVVQDAFLALYRRWGSIREPKAVPGYLRASVVNGSRSALRKRRTVRRHLTSVVDETVEGADGSSILSAEHEMLRAALSRLPQRQREVLTLRFIAELSDADIAQATGLSQPGVRSASSRGLAALRTALGGAL